MARNIKAQFQYAVNNGFKEGLDKHSYKQKNDTNDKVFSYNEKFRLLDVAKNLHNFMKSEFPEIKQIKDISPAVIQSFLNSKTDNCTQNTIDSYAASLYKLQTLANNTYGCRLNWREKIIVPRAITKSDSSRGVGNQIDEESYSKIMAYCRENRSRSGDAILLQDNLGVRVEELARIKIKNIDFDTKTLFIDNAKGGKGLTRSIVGCEDLLRTILNKKYDDKGVFLINVKGDSINTHLRRLEAKLGLERYSNHNIRAYIAQRHYDDCRASGMSMQGALESTSRWLNHIKPRERMMTKSYIILR